MSANTGSWILEPRNRASIALLVSHAWVRFPPLRSVNHDGINDFSGQSRSIIATVSWIPEHAQTCRLALGSARLGRLEIPHRGVRREARRVARRDVPAILLACRQRSRVARDGRRGVHHEGTRGDIDHAQIIIRRPGHRAPTQRHRAARQQRPRTAGQTRTRARRRAGRHHDCRCLEIPHRGVRREARRVARRDVPAILLACRQRSRVARDGRRGVHHEGTRGDIDHAQIIIRRPGHRAPTQRHRAARQQRPRTAGQTRTRARRRAGRHHDCRCLEIPHRGVRRESCRVARCHVPPIRLARCQCGRVARRGCGGIDHKAARGNIHHAQVIVSCPG